MQIERHILLNSSNRTWILYTFSLPHVNFHHCHCPSKAISSWVMGVPQLQGIQEKEKSHPGHTSMGQQGQRREITASSVRVRGGQADLAQPRQAHDISQQIISELRGISMSTVNFSLMKNDSPRGWDISAHWGGSGHGAALEEDSPLLGIGSHRSWGRFGVGRAPLCRPVLSQWGHLARMGCLPRISILQQLERALVATKELQLQIWGAEVPFSDPRSSVPCPSPELSRSGSAGSCPCWAPPAPCQQVQTFPALW